MNPFKRLGFVLVMLLFFVLASCGNGEDEPDDNDVIEQAPSFNVRVAFESIHIMIEDVTDADDQLMDFQDFYDLIDKDISGLTLYSTQDEPDDIFYSFNDLKALEDVDFDEDQGSIVIQGDIELNTGAFAPEGSFEAFEVFKHDRASISVFASDGSWEASKSVAVPYLTIDAKNEGDAMRLTLSGNAAYGDDDLSFLPAFILNGAYDVNILEATGDDYIEAKAQSKIVADLSDNHIYAWYEWVDEYSDGIENITAINLSLSNNDIIVEASKESDELFAAMTLYFMDGNIGTIQYLQVRFMGSKETSMVDVSPIEGSGDQTTITSDYFNVVEGESLDLDDNEITDGKMLLTNDLLVGQFLDRLEKESMYQTWKVTTLEDRPLSPSVFGPALSKNPHEDTISNGDVLSVLSADWTTIRYYRLNVLDIYPYLDDINEADDAQSLYEQLEKEALKLDIVQAHKQHYFKAYVASGYLDDETFEQYAELKAFVEEVNQTAAQMIEKLLDVNQADDEASLFSALEALEDLEKLEGDYSQAYWQAYVEHNYTEKDFIATDEVQAFIDEVNEYMQAIEAKLQDINAATDAKTLLTALKSVDSLTNINADYKAGYYEGYLEGGYDDEKVFTFIDEVQAFIDDINETMDDYAHLLEAMNNATTSEALIEALTDDDLNIESVDEDHVMAYWSAYEQSGYLEDKAFITPSEVQAFVNEVNTEIADRMATLSSVNEATNSASLLEALKDEDLDLKNVENENEDAYWQAYQEEGYDDDNKFYYIEVVQAFIDEVNAAIDQEEPPQDDDLSDLNDATNADALLQALKDLNLDNVNPSNKQAYWQAYQHEGYDNDKTFDSIQEAQGFVNGVNAHPGGP